MQASNCGTLQSDHAVRHMHVDDVESAVAVAPSGTRTEGVTL